jgi:glycosyltransferase involved in cell wall biosynthesis
MDTAATIRQDRCNPMNDGKPLRVCYFGTYRADYARNRNLITALQRNGVEVVECHARLWHGVEDRVQAVTGNWRRPAFWGRVLRTYCQLLRTYWRTVGHYDILVVGYPGQFDVFLARLLSWWRGKPLVWDILMSIHLVAVERALHERAGAMVDLLRRIEGLACRLPDRLLLDTEAYVDWFHQTYQIAPDRFRLIPLGANSDIYRPPAAPTGARDGFYVIYYGSFIPNHGVPCMVEAASLLQETDIRFEFVGAGPDRAAVEAWVRERGLRNVTFIDWLDSADLVARIAAADLCLGSFGTTPQSLMTVHNKIYEAMALGKPVITGDGPAVRHTFVHGEDLYLCPRADPAALAAAIRTLHADPLLRNRLAQQGRRRFVAEFTLEQLGARFKQHLMELAGRVDSLCPRVS